MRCNADDECHAGYMCAKMNFLYDHPDYFGECTYLHWYRGPYNLDVGWDCVYTPDEGYHKRVVACRQKNYVQAVNSSDYPDSSCSHLGPKPNEYQNCTDAGPPCFPAAATVQVRQGGGSGAVVSSTVADMQLGDEIRVAYQNGTLGFEKVLIITGLPNVTQAYVTLHLQDGTTLTVSAEHYVQAGSTCCDQTGLAPPHSLVEGGSLWVGDSDSGIVVRKRIMSISYSTEVGAYNMFTASDSQGRFVNLMVDNVVASSFTEYFELVSECVSECRVAGHLLTFTAELTLTSSLSDTPLSVSLSVSVSGQVEGAGADAAHEFMQPLFTMFAFNENLTLALANTSKSIINDVGIKMMRIPGD
jgi:hypothetical protein